MTGRESPPEKPDVKKNLPARSKSPTATTPIKGSMMSPKEMTKLLDLRRLPGNLQYSFRD
jgi:hypothetical protein